MQVLLGFLQEKSLRLLSRLTIPLTASLFSLLPLGIPDKENVSSPSLPSFYKLS